MSDSLNIQTSLRAANIARQAEWDPSDKITLTYRLNELAGETGEACNVGKKIERERLGIRGSRDTVEHLAEELADVVICADLVAMAEGIDLDAAVVAKFNATSEKVGLRTRLAAPAPEGGATGAKAVILNGQIIISVDVDALPIILSGSISLNVVAGTFKVTDALTFAKEVCYALNAEKEDGTTRVHMMFDSAFNHAIDQGAEGVEEISEDEFEAEAARLQAEAKGG